MKRGRIIFITNQFVPVSNAGGGGIVVFRHLQRFLNEGFEVILIDFAITNVKQYVFQSIELPKQAFYPPLRKWTPFLTDLRVALEFREIKRKLRFEKNDILLGIFGDYTNLLGVKLSRYYQLPLFLLYHDDNLFNSYGKLNILSKRHVKYIFRHTNHFFAVSQPMKQLLESVGAKSCSTLYPIPNGFKAPSSREGIKTEKSYYSTGLLFDDLHLELMEMIAECAEKTGSRLTNIGHLTKLFSEKLSKYKSVKLINRFEQTSEVLNYLVEHASVLLVFYSFKPHLEHRMFHSFPSKLAEYSHLGKPILIIAPPISSLGKWAIENHWLSYLDNDDPDQLMTVMRKFDDENFIERCKEQSAYVAKTQFNPEYIHKSLCDIITKNAC